MIHQHSYTFSSIFFFLRTWTIDHIVKFFNDKETMVYRSQSVVMHG